MLKPTLRNLLAMSEFFQFCTSRAVVVIAFWLGVAFCPLAFCNVALAQITVDQNLQELGNSNLKSPAKSDIVIVQRTVAAEQTIGSIGGNRRGFIVMPFGNVFIPLRPITITNYSDNAVAAATGTNQVKVAYDNQLLAERGGAALQSKVGGGGGLGLGYYFKNINLSIIGYAGYVRQGASWSKDYSTNSFFSNPANGGITTQGWDLATNNILASVGTYYNIFLGNTVTIGLGGDVGMNYSTGTLNYNQTILNNLISGSGSSTVVTPINVTSSLVSDVSGIQGFVAPRVNIDFYIPLYKPGATPGVLSAIIINTHVAYYYPFNNIKFAFDANGVDNNGLPSGTARSGQLQSLAEGLSVGLGVALQF